MQKDQTKRWEHVPLESLPMVAAELVTLLSKPSFVAIQGEMGAGKTTFVQALLRELGIEHPDGSPTYAIVHEYVTKLGINAYHLDCYRIENENELLNLGLEELLDSNAYFFIEWPQKIERILPKHHFRLYIRIESDLSREITLHYDH